MLKYDFHLAPEVLRDFSKSFVVYFITLWGIVVVALLSPEFNYVRAMLIATAMMLGAVLVVVVCEMVEYHRCWVHRANQYWRPH